MNKKKYKIALFDLDGTLTDPKEGITNCVQYALNEYGYYDQPMEKLMKFIGPPLKDSFAEFYGFDETAALDAVEKYRERFRNIGIFENAVFDGVEDMLKTLSEKGIIVCVASSKPEEFVLRILEHFHILEYFDIVRGSMMNGDRGTKAEVIDSVLEALQAENIEYNLSDIVMIGDRLHDIEGAKIIGVDSIGVAFGYGGRSELEAYGATYIVDTMEEIVQLIL